MSHRFDNVPARDSDSFSSGSESGAARRHDAATASPPYAHHGGATSFGASSSFAAMPPNYASRTDLGTVQAGQGSAYPQDKGKAPSPPSSADDAAAAAGGGGGGGQGTTIRAPRIAVTDPLGDMRSRNLSKPEGLGARSDYPPNLNLKLKTDKEGHFMGAGAGRAASGTDSTGPPRPGFARQDSFASIASDDGYYDDFDWSDDEGVAEEAKYEEEQRQLEAFKKRRGRFAPSKIIRWLATTFLGNLIISGILLVPFIVVQLVYRPKAAGASQAQIDRNDYIADCVQTFTLWAAVGLHLSWWLHALVEIVPAVALGLIRAVWGNISQRVLSAAEFYNVIKQYIKFVFYAALSWGALALLSSDIYDIYSQINPKTESRAPWMYRVYQVVQFIFFLTLIICAEQVLIKLIAMSFHRSAYAERISEVTKALKTFDHLRDHRPQVHAAHHKANSTFGINPKTESRAPWMYRVYQVVQFIFFLTLIICAEQVLIKLIAMSFHRSAYAERISEVTKALKTFDHLRDHRPQVHAAHHKANSTFGVNSGARTPGRSPMATLATFPDGYDGEDERGATGSGTTTPKKSSFFSRGKKHSNKRPAYSTPADQAGALPPHATSANSAPATPATPKSGNVASRIASAGARTVKAKAVSASTLARIAMNDPFNLLTQQNLGLDRLLLGVAFIIVLFVAFAVFNLNIGKSLSTFYSLAIAFAFIFKETFGNVFDSIVFLFVTHPFDTGDRICLDTDVMAVKKMSLLSSEFTLWNNTNLYIANELLSTMLIVNYRRSGYQWECATMQVAFDTPLETLDAVQADVIHWMQTEPERMFEPSTAIVPQTIDYMRSIERTAKAFAFQGGDGGGGA
ncbi:Predicted mechanosensitive ion channel [Ceraceosorus bombacis]|uniref:Predicted mechanosensitive ion channel n=1 Tax=Ceraceosorus bombacis TaxID=401625 RepID=A0A0P1BSA0_9BASI|nr:Predicted mechanosensitive ion channel [Ceraceosorus bombacis]